MTTRYYIHKETHGTYSIVDSQHKYGEGEYDGGTGVMIPYEERGVAVIKAGCETREDAEQIATKLESARLSMGDDLIHDPTFSISGGMIKHNVIGHYWRGARDGFKIEVYAADRAAIDLEYSWSVVSTDNKYVHSAGYTKTIMGCKRSISRAINQLKERVA